MLATSAYGSGSIFGCKDEVLHELAGEQSSPKIPVLMPRALAWDCPVSLGALRLHAVGYLVKG